MADPHVITGLREKRRQIQVEIDRLERIVAGHRADVLQIEATIRIVNGDPAAKSYDRLRVQKRIFDRGECGLIIYATLRRADRPVSTGEIVNLIALEKGLDQADKVVIANLMKRVGKTLGKYRQRGHIEGERRGNMTWWRLSLPL